MTELDKFLDYVANHEDIFLTRDEYSKIREYFNVREVTISSYPGCVAFHNFPETFDDDLSLAMTTNSADKLHAFFKRDRENTLKCEKHYETTIGMLEDENQKLKGNLVILTEQNKGIKEANDRLWKTARNEMNRNEELTKDLEDLKEITVRALDDSHTLYKSTERWEISYDSFGPSAKAKLRKKSDLSDLPDESFFTF